MEFYRPSIGHATSALTDHNEDTPAPFVVPDEREVVPPQLRSPQNAHSAALLERQPLYCANASSVSTCASINYPTLGRNGNADLNRVHLTGRLGSEPQLCSVGDHPVARLALVSERYWHNPLGGLQVETTWFNLDAWEELADYCGRWLHKGDRVYAEGYLHLWVETRDGHSFGCHTIVLDRIVLLRPGEGEATAELVANGGAL